MTQHPQIEIIEDVISKLPLDQRVKIANLDENDIELLQQVFDRYVQSNLGEDIEDDDATDIMYEIWKRLRDGYRLRVVK